MEESGRMHTIPIAPPDGLPRQAVEAYLGRCRERLPALQAAIQRQDFEFVRVYGHGMKGCGSPYGFLKLTETGAALEQSARARQTQELQRLATELEAYLAAVELTA
jgi:HPt (histidine-containing phosphotransfer) domain-containing protein